jgi:uncharacterized protein YpmB
MNWIFYDNADESTQIFIGVLLILFITIIIVANVFFWLADKIKSLFNKTKNKSQF